MFLFKTRIKAVKKLINKLEAEIDTNFKKLADNNFQNIEDLKSGKADRGKFFMKQPEKENEILEELYKEFLNLRQDYNLLIERFFFDNKKIEQIHVDFFNYLKIYKNAFDKITLGCPINLAVEKVAKDEIVRRFTNLKKE